MYALVEIKGKQYKAEDGALLKVDKLNLDNGVAVEFDSVLLISDNGKVNIGQPFITGAKIVAKVEDLKKDKKVSVVKFKKRKGYMRNLNHRQQYSFIKVEKIIGA